MLGLAAIERNADLQARLIADILDMSRLNLGKLRLDRDWVDAGGIVAATVTAVQPLLQRSNHRLTLDLEDGAIRIHADEVRVQQVLWNLIGNAVKFSPPGSEITLSLRARDKGATMTVSDQGQGIDPEFLPFVFDRFAQSDVASNRQHGGLGLGLAIVKNLVESHGGHVSVASAGLGQGSQFSIWLPGEPEPSSPQDAAPSNFITRADPLVGLKVLVVEDDLEAGAMLSMILGEQGMQVRHAVSADDALATLTQQRFDVLVSDVGMPGRDGYQLIRELRQLETTGRHLPAIALTAFSRDRDRTLALEAGFDAHVGKPLRPQQLLAEILRITGANA